MMPTRGLSQIWGGGSKAKPLAPIAPNLVIPGRYNSELMIVLCVYVLQIARSLRATAWDGNCFHQRVVGYLRFLPWDMCYLYFHHAFLPVPVVGSPEVILWRRLAVSFGSSLFLLAEHPPCWQGTFPHCCEVPYW